MDIRYCARLFERHHLYRAAVIENREVIGIVSYADIVLKGMKSMLGEGMNRPARIPPVGSCVGSRRMAQSARTISSTCSRRAPWV